MARVTLCIFYLRRVLVASCYGCYGSSSCDGWWIDVFVFGVGLSYCLFDMFATHASDFLIMFTNQFTSKPIIYVLNKGYLCVK